MKKQFLILSLFFISVNVFAQQQLITPESKILQHPRLLWTADEDSMIKEAVISSPVLARVHETILNECEVLLTTPLLERNQIGRRILHTSRECLRRVFFLSYAWRMTGKEAYAKRAEAEMLNVCAFDEWNPSVFLDVSEMTLALSIGYDWLFYWLPPESKDIIKTNMVAKGLEPSFRPHGWPRLANNWNQVCNCSMAFGAMAVFEDFPSLAALVLNRSLESIPIAMRGYDPDGAYSEGYGYWMYGSEFNTVMIDGVEKALGYDFELTKYKGFMNTASYITNILTPSGRSYNYGDNGLGGGRGLKVPVFWFGYRNNDPTLVWGDVMFIQNNPGKNYVGNRFLPMTILWGSKLDYKKIVSPKSKLFWMGRGDNPVSFMRTAWNDPNAIFVGAKGGKASISHGHMDAGSFMMEANGVRWAYDMGMEDYHSIEKEGLDLWNMKQDSERWTLFRYGPFSHNTLIVNNAPQLVDGQATIERSSDSPAFMHAIINLDEIYAGQLLESRRGVALVNKKYTLVRDEVVNRDKESVVRWNMITDAEIEIVNNTTAILKKGTKKLTLKGQSDMKFSIKQWPMELRYDYESRNKGFSLIGFEMELPANAKGTLAVWLLPENAKPGANDWKKILKEW